MTINKVTTSKKVWQTPTVEIISIAQGQVPHGIEGVSTSNHNFTPARSASRYHS